MTQSAPLVTTDGQYLQNERRPAPEGETPDPPLNYRTGRGLLPGHQRGLSPRPLTPRNLGADHLCALAVAPDDVDLRPMLLAGLKARYARVTREPNVFPRAVPVGSTRRSRPRKHSLGLNLKLHGYCTRTAKHTLWSRLGSNQRRQWPKPRHADEHLIDVTPAVPGMCQARQLHGITARTLRPRNA